MAAQVAVPLLGGDLGGSEPAVAAAVIGGASVDVLVLQTFVPAVRAGVVRAGHAGHRTLEAAPGVEPELTRFAGGAFTANDYAAVRAPGRSRTCHFQIRNLALFPLSYEGMGLAPHR